MIIDLFPVESVETSRLFTETFILLLARNDEVAPPNLDIEPRYHSQISTAATATVAALLAKASKLFEPFQTQYPNYAQQLKNSAVNSWKFLKNHPEVITYSNTGFSVTYHMRYL